MQQIGRYEIQKLLGQGGFGNVYLAFDPSVGRKVALKVLTAASSDSLSRFRNEAATVGKLQHPNIVAIYDYGEHESRPYIAMEFVEGHTLQHYVREGSLALIRKIEVMYQVAGAMAVAHGHGIVHRDIKPANIMITAEGVAKVMDFGLARLSESSGVTRQGDVIGTIAYMAPELFNGNIADARSDIYAYGSLFYELLSGRPPFSAASPAELMYRITTSNPEPLRALVPDCPEDLETIIQRSLARDPDFRYQRFEEVQFDLEPILHHLRSEKAIGLIEQVRKSVYAGDLDHAQSGVREVLELDPYNKDARQLRDHIGSIVRTRDAAARVEKLLQAATASEQASRFSEAVSAYQDALRLQPDDAAIKRRLQQATANQERLRVVAEYVVEARRLTDAGDFTHAAERLARAQEEFPGDPELAELERAIHADLERRQHSSQREAAIHAAQECLQSSRFAEAVKIIEMALQKAPGEPALTGLLERTRLELEKTRGAKARLDPQLKPPPPPPAPAAPPSPAPTSASGHTQMFRSPLGAASPAPAAAPGADDHIAGADTEARARTDAGDYAGAASILRSALSNFPAHQGLLTLLEQAAKSEIDSRLGVPQAECNRLLLASHYDDALKVVEAAIRRDPDLGGLHELRARVLTERERARLESDRRSAMSEVDRLLAAGSQELALRLAEANLLRYSTDAEVIAQSHRVRESARIPELPDKAVNDARQGPEIFDFESARRYLRRWLA
jgi:serine/threonine protein kinase